MKYLVVIASVLAINVPTYTAAQSAKELLREHITTYSAAALTARLCLEARWNIDHDLETLRITENQLAELGVSKAEADEIATLYLKDGLDAELFEYFKAKGVTRFLGTPKTS